MPLKFAANISMLFTEAAGLESRYALAKEAGFKAVECMFPYDLPVDKLVAAKKSSGLTHVLINSYPGNWKAGDRGLCALPSRVAEFKDSLELSIKYAKALECKRIHIMSGCRTDALSRSAMEKVYLENLQFSVRRLEQADIVGLIEPINSRLTIPNYFMDQPSAAVDFVKRLNSPNLKLQLDIFHLQITSGDLTANIQRYLPFTGHVQIAQVPGRHEPDSDGEINYSYVLRLLSDLGYDGWMGLEYNPVGDTVEGLQWMSRLNLANQTLYECSIFNLQFQYPKRHKAVLACCGYGYDLHLFPNTSNKETQTAIN